MVTRWQPEASWCKSPRRKQPMPKNSWRPESSESSLMTPGKEKRLAELKKLLPAGGGGFVQSVLKAHAGDKWFATHVPDAVALPKSTESISALLRFANQKRIPVTPRGAGH